MIVSFTRRGVSYTYTVAASITEQQAVNFVRFRYPDAEDIKVSYGTKA